MSSVTICLLRITMLFVRYASQVLGWASLIAAAGVSYYFAKKSIDERRMEQYAAGTRPTEKLDCMLTSHFVGD